MSHESARRAIWPLLKARVTERTDHYVKLSFGYDCGSPTTILIPHNALHLYDIREGDLLTLYTEVLLAQPS